MHGEVGLPEGGKATEDIAASQHDNKRHQQEDRDGGQGDKQKEAWKRDKGKESNKMRNNWLLMG